MPNDFSWLPPPLTREEERLVELYVQTGRSLDALPYTEEFERLVEKYQGDKSPEACREVWMQLLRLRKQARLPRTSLRPT